MQLDRTLFHFLSLRGAMIALVLLLPFFGRAEQAPTSEMRAELGETGLRESRLFSVDVYGEAYRFPVSSQLALMGRLRLLYGRDRASWHPYFEVN